MPADALDTAPVKSISWVLLPAVLVSASAILLFAMRGTSLAITLVGYGMLAAGLVVAWLLDRASRSDGLFKDLLLIAVGMVIVST
ncbi:MAG: hypothetical protein WA006_11090, partial [Rhodoglobus sp.]